MNSDGAYFVFTIFLFFSIYMAVAITLFIVYKLLNKYNNFGDTTCNLDEYSPWGIKYNRMRDDVLIHEKTDFFLYYGENPYEGRKHSIPEQLIKNGEKNKSDNEPL